MELLGGAYQRVLWEGGGGSVHGLSSVIVLLCLCVIDSLQRVRERGVHCERGAGNAIPFRCPGAEVGQLTSFRAKGAPGIAFPDTELVTEGADHAMHYTMLSLKIGQDPTGADLMCRGGLLPRWLSLFNLGPGVFKRHRTVKYQCAGG
jgi:hypothetical protein